MYFAMVFFCLAGGDCLVAEDKYGPYRTAERCDVRIEEMKQQIRQITPHVEIKSSLCKQIGNNA